MIRFGIDLGTTNSAIAKFESGELSLFRNPSGLRQTLPSVVAYRKNRIVVGDKAREYLRRDPQNVVANFKRKMGSDERYPIASLQSHKTPVELSAEVLKELKNFVHTGETIDAAVITIPASFDTIQSNATKEAGKLAGFEQVVLLQEPIAASLAYANKANAGFEEGQWLVYDLGGGTFDVALIRIEADEMRVVDHVGDNFIGGSDFDRLIVEKLIVPKLLAEGQFEDLEIELRSAKGKRQALFHKLLLLAEDAKVLLSNTESADIEFEVEDDEGELLDLFFSISRSEFEALIAPHVERTIDMLESMLQAQDLAPQALKFALLVGGSTYIPLVRQRIAERLQIEVNCDIDPTTAVAIGAAHFAATKAKAPTESKNSSEAPSLQIKTAYQKASRDEEEYFTALVQGDCKDLFYRIRRLDGGYDSGRLPLQERISAYLPLVAKQFNQFSFTVYDEQNNEIRSNLETIGIAQGQYSVVGQPLPNDISLEVDDVENAQTQLELLFAKNTILPTKRSFIKQVQRNIKKDSDDQIIIKIVEGPVSALPSANQTIGFIAITGRELERDLIKGSDIEISLEITESRDLHINVYLMMTDQEFEDVFRPSARAVNVTRLQEESLILLEKINTELLQAKAQEHFELANTLSELKSNTRQLHIRSKQISEDDTTDEKFQLEDQKRKIAQEVDKLTRDKGITALKKSYFENKHDLQSIIERSGEAGEAERQELERILEQEKTYLASNSRFKLQEIEKQFNRIRARIIWKDINYLANVFFHYRLLRPSYSDKAAGDAAIAAGEKALEEENLHELRHAINQLHSLVPEEKKDDKFTGGTGIG